MKITNEDRILLHLLAEKQKQIRKDNDDITKECSISEIAKGTGIPRGSISRPLNRLEKRGFIKRHRSAIRIGKRRGLGYTLEKEGYIKAQQIMEKILDEKIDSISQEGCLKTLREILTEKVDNSPQDNALRTFDERVEIYAHQKNILGKLLDLLQAHPNAQSVQEFKLEEPKFDDAQKIEEEERIERKHISKFFEKLGIDRGSIEGSSMILQSPPDFSLPSELLPVYQKLLENNILIFDENDETSCAKKVLSIMYHFFRKMRLGPFLIEPDQLKRNLPDFLLLPLLFQPRSIVTIWCSKLVLSDDPLKSFIIEKVGKVLPTVK